MIETVFVLGAIFLVLVVSAVTNKQLEKMKQLERMFIQHEKSRLSVSEFCKRRGIHQSKYYYWKRRYEEQKESGLIDRRRGISYKVTRERRTFIIEYKIKHPLSSCEDIVSKFKKKFKIDIHFTWVAQILREEKLSDPVGRKTGKPLKKTRK